MLTKNELRTLWKKTNFRPLKRLGQNFLIDKNVRDKILKNLELNPDDIVIEIGSGFGELTFGLAKGAKKVFAVESDKKIVKILKSTFEIPDNVAVLKKNFLDIDIKELAPEGGVVLCGNLPYYITTPVIEKAFNNISLINSIYFVVQKEVAERILAMPGSKNIGRLSLYAQYYTEPKYIFKIAKSSFYPAPQVESIFLKFEVLKNRKVQVADEALLFTIIKKAYSQRRKTIINSLSGIGIEKGALAYLLKSTKLNSQARAEDLSLQDFASLAHGLRNLL